MELKQIQKLFKEQTMNRINRQPTEWEKIFANHMFDNELNLNIFLKTPTTQS